MAIWTVSSRLKDGGLEGSTKGQKTMVTAEEFASCASCGEFYKLRLKVASK